MDNTKESTFVSKNKRNVWLDLFRYFLAFLVICIHFDSTIFGFRIKQFCTLAVPLFFMISGFFAYGENKDARVKKAKKNAKSAFVYLLICVSIYIVYNIIVNINNPTSLQNIFLGIFNKNMFFNFFILNTLSIPHGYHIWFLVAFFLVALFHYFMEKYDKTKLYKAILIVCFLVYFLPVIYKAIGYSVSFGELSYRRNWLFLGIPCFCLGYVLKDFIKNKDNSKKWKGFLWLGLSLVFLAAIYFEDLLVKGGEAYFLTSLLSGVFFLLFFDFLSKVEKSEKISKVESKISNIFYKWIGVKGSFYIYVLHVLVGLHIKKLISIDNFWINVVIFLVSFTIYEICYLSVMFFKYLKLKKQKKEK